MNFYRFTKAVQLFLLALMLVFSSCVHYSNDFDAVTSRLNTPHRIDKYQRKNFSYATTFEGYGCGGVGVDISVNTSECSPEFIFHAKKGNCGAFTTFAVYCLRKAGYEAYPLKIYFLWPARAFPRAKHRNYHYMALYKEKNKWYIMDNGRRRNIKGITGPFNSIKEIPYKIVNIEGKKS